MEKEMKEDVVLIQDGFCEQTLVEYEDDNVEGSVCCVDSMVECTGNQYVCLNCGFVKGYRYW